MREGLDLNEVLSLAKTMEVKVYGFWPPLEAQNQVINFDPNDPRENWGCLKEW